LEQTELCFCLKKFRENNRLKKKKYEILIPFTFDGLDFNQLIQIQEADIVLESALNMQYFAWKAPL
jgi:hypothetical protein